jgi:hypothetical protein
MRTADKLKRLGDDTYALGEYYRTKAAELIRLADRCEAEAISLWATLEPPPCSSTDSSASPSA